MAEFREGVSLISIEEEMKNSYLDYAMSVIVSRALPDVRDGLKPVHRRVIYAQYEMGNDYNKAYKKSARIVGDVMGKYHPHGDSALYGAVVRMAQDFSMRVPLVDGQGNFGSMDGDSAAAMRYTEVRMAKITHSLIKDIEKDTVNFVPNYDGNDNEPTVLPARFPNLLVNGTSGIAVGMATNIPPHNLGEVIDAAVFLVDNPECETEALFDYVKGPDFPTGGMMMGQGGSKTAFLTGRGSVVLRGRTHIETDKNGKEAIIITEVPYQVNKAEGLVMKIAQLVKDKVIDGITDLRDESDRDGVRVVIEIRRDAHNEVVLSQLYKHTPLQSFFSYNMLALDKGRPRIMGLKDILSCFVAHREEVITRRTKFDLRKARVRAHLLVGLAIAVANIDEVIKIVRHSSSPAEAKLKLLDIEWDATQVLALITLLGDRITGNTYRLSADQVQAILDLKLHRLTGLERDKINTEADEIASFIRELIRILSNRDVMLGILKDELQEVKMQFDTPRRTSIEEGSADVNLEDLIKPEEMVVTISTDGYVKRQRMSDYRAQRRGGKGKSAANMRDDEEIQDFFIANTHVPLFFFSTNGKVYKLKVYELPVATSGARGKAFINLLPLEKDERIMRVVPVPKDQEDWEGKALMFATEMGIVRKTPLKAFNNVYANGIRGISLNEGDNLINVRMTEENSGDLLLNSANGKAVRFPITTLRTIASRTAFGVKGMTLKDDDKLVSMDVINEIGEDAVVDSDAMVDSASESADAITENSDVVVDSSNVDGSSLASDSVSLAGVTPFILSVTKNGFGKRTKIEDFPAKSRGTMGVIAIKTGDRNGKVVASLPIGEEDHIMIATNQGQVIRMKASDISVIGRNTQGVTLFKVGKKEVVTSVSRIPADDMHEDDGVKFDNDSDGEFSTGEDTDTDAVNESNVDSEISELNENIASETAETPTENASEDTSEVTE